MKLNSVLFSALFLVSYSGFSQNSQEICHTGHAHKTNRGDAAALDTRSDSIDITHTQIALDFTNLPAQILFGGCSIQFKAKVDGINKIVLDLLDLTVDSVKQNGVVLSFSQANAKVPVVLSETLNADDTTSIDVYYHGLPAEDLRFGGFSFQGNFAYNIGVGFLADPHNFGRAWFPCFDNFVERCPFTVIVKTPEQLSSYCGGLLTDETVENNVRTRSWQLDQEIPSYLASVAICNFTEVTRTINSVLNPELPIILAAVPTDTTALKNAFVSLDTIFHLFESHWGPYQWDRIGYVVVPFTAGAMEHATNIAYPQFLLLAGAAGNQHTMAHELAHHWFGDLTTCRTASEMWLNEGFAAYNERLFDEWLSGRESYEAGIRNNHLKMVNFAHIRDGGYWPLSNVPHAYTYGRTSYYVGSDKIHTLRSYTGDSLFYVGLRNYLTTNSFHDATSNTLRDNIESATGLQLDNFFTDWVDTPGWPEFSVDSFRVESGTVNVYVRQKSAGNDHIYTDVPFQVSFRNAAFELENKTALISGPYDTLSFTLPFEPAMVYLNRDEKISQAVTSEERFFKTTGNLSLTNALLEINTVAVSDSVFLRVEHHWVEADPAKAWYFVHRVSPNRFWKVDGILKPGFKASAKFTYNGKTPPAFNASSGWLDHTLITDETKLVLLYRRNTADDWKVSDAVLTTLSSTTDKLGSFTLDSLMIGEYTFAQTDSALGLQPVSGISEEAFLLFPNPATENVQLSWTSGPNTPDAVELIDIAGKRLGHIPVTLSENTLVFPVGHLESGNYFIRIYKNRKMVAVKKVVVSRRK